jgi:hypothetical protein
LAKEAIFPEFLFGRGYAVNDLSDLPIKNGHSETPFSTRGFAEALEHPLGEKECKCCNHDIIAYRDLTRVFSAPLLPLI